MLSRLGKLLSRLSVFGSEDHGPWPGEQRRAERAAHTPTGRLSAPEDIASAIVFLSSPANRNVTGETLNVTGGA